MYLAASRCACRECSLVLRLCRVTCAACCGRACSSGKPALIALHCAGAVCCAAHGMGAVTCAAPSGASMTVCASEQARSLECAAVLAACAALWTHSRVDRRLALGRSAQFVRVRCASVRGGGVHCLSALYMKMRANPTRTAEMERGRGPRTGTGGDRGAWIVHATRPVHGRSRPRTPDGDRRVGQIRQVGGIAARLPESSLGVRARP